MAADGDEAAIVEEANKRYTALLLVKASADKFTDQEAQVSPLSVSQLFNPATFVG